MRVEDVHRIMNSLIVVDNQKEYEQWKERRENLIGLCKTIDANIRAECYKGHAGYAVQNLPTEYIPYIANYYENAGFIVQNMPGQYLYIRW